MTATSVLSQTSESPVSGTGNADFQVGAQGWITLNPPGVIEIREGGNDIEITNMTERHGMKPEHLHKLHRLQDTMPDNCVWLGDKPPSQTWVKGVGPGIFGGAAKMIWEFEDLMAM